MVRPRIKKNAKYCAFYLETEEINMVKWLAGNSGLSVSSWLGNIIRNCYDNTDVGRKHRKLKEEIEIEEKRIIELKDELNKISEVSIRKEEFFSKQKEQFIKNLVECIKNGKTFGEIREFAINQSVILNNKYTADELLDIAYKQIQ